MIYNQTCQINRMRIKSILIVSVLALCAFSVMRDPGGGVAPVTMDSAIDHADQIDHDAMVTVQDELVAPVQVCAVLASTPVNHIAISRTDELEKPGWRWINTDHVRPYTEGRDNERVLAVPV